MRLIICTLLTLLGMYFAVPATGHADIILTVDAADFPPGTASGVVDIYARSDSADSLISFTVDFELAGGSFREPAGVFGAAGMIGFGNVNSASFFFRNSDRSASLSLDFNSPQSISADNQILASLQLDLTGLPVGFYPISIVDSVADAGRVNVLIGSFDRPGGIYVQVPEPSSFGLCGLVVAWAVVSRRSRSGAGRRQAEVLGRRWAC